MCWRVRQDYLELKDELGLDHFEGRSWRGFHYYLALVKAAFVFLRQQSKGVCTAAHKKSLPHPRRRKRAAACKPRSSA